METSDLLDYVRGQISFHGLPVTNVAVDGLEGSRVVLALHMETGVRRLLVVDMADDVSQVSSRMMELAE